jgi:hypothetical protein
LSKEKFAKIFQIIGKKFAKKFAKIPFHEDLLSGCPHAGLDGGSNPDLLAGSFPETTPEPDLCAQTPEIPISGLAVTYEFFFSKKSSTFCTL